MANKSAVIRKTVNAGGVDTSSETQVVPDGSKWLLFKFGAADINAGDNKSSVFIIQWGSTGNWEDVRIITLTGNSVEVDINKEFTGDGTKKFRVLLQNNSATNKELAFWYDLIERG